MEAYPVLRYQADRSDIDINNAPIDLTIPASQGFSDLTRSYLVLNMGVTVTDDQDTTVIHPTTFGQQAAPGTGTTAQDHYATMAMTGPQVLLNNCKIRSASGITVERNDINIIDSNLPWYSRSRSQENSAATFGNTITENYGRSKTSLGANCPFINFETPGPNEKVSTSAITRNADILIDWRHIDPMANMQKFPNMLVGDMNYQIQFERDFNGMVLAEQSVQGFAIDDIAAVGSHIGEAGTLLVTTADATAFARPPLVGECIEYKFFEKTSDAVAIGMAEIQAVTVDANGKYNLQIVGGIDTTAATEACAGIYILYGPRVRQGDLTRGGFAVDDLAAVQANGFGSDANPLIMTDFLKDSYTGANRQSDYDIDAAVGYHCITWGRLNTTASDEANTINDMTDFALPGGNAVTYTLTNNIGAEIQVGDVVVIAGTNNAGAGAVGQVNGTDIVTAVAGATFTVGNLGAGVTKGAAPTYNGSTVISKRIVADYNTISAVETNNDDLQIELTTPYVSTAGFVASFTNVEFMYTDRRTATADAFSVAWNIDFVSAQMRKVQLSPQEMQLALDQVKNGLSLAFLKEEVNPYTLSANTKLEETVQLEEGCVAVALLTPQTDQVVSGFDNVTSYQGWQDGKMLTTSQVNTGMDPDTTRSIHNFMLKQFFANLGQAVRKYDAHNVSYDAPGQTIGTQILNPVTHSFFPFIVRSEPAPSVLKTRLLSSVQQSAKTHYYVAYYPMYLNIQGEEVEVSKMPLA